MGIIINILFALSIVALVIRSSQINKKIAWLDSEVRYWKCKPNVNIEAYNMDTWGKGTVINYPYKGIWTPFPVRKNKIGVLTLGKMLGFEYKDIPESHQIEHEELKRIGYTVHHIENYGADNQ